MLNISTILLSAHFNSFEHKSPTQFSKLFPIFLNSCPILVFISSFVVGSSWYTCYLIKLQSKNWIFQDPEISSSLLSIGLGNVYLNIALRFESNGLGHHRVIKKIFWLLSVVENPKSFQIRFAKTVSGWFQLNFYQVPIYGFQQFQPKC